MYVSIQLQKIRECQYSFELYVCMKAIDPEIYFKCTFIKLREKNRLWDSLNKRQFVGVINFFFLLKRKFCVSLSDLVFYSVKILNILMLLFYLVNKLYPLKNSKSLYFSLIILCKSYVKSKKKKPPSFIFNNNPMVNKI